MIPGRPRCSATARSREEQLIATASTVRAWLLVEQPGPWGPEAIMESRLPHEVAEPLRRRGRDTGVRILLIRRVGTESPARAVFLAHSGGGGVRPQLVEDTFADPRTLLDLDLAALARGQIVGVGRPMDLPIYLVCTHGRHDICCADHGRPLFRAAMETLPDRVWESSHIGGDRFAGNLLALPHGAYFGRLGSENARAVIQGFEEGQLTLEHFRGLSSRPWMVQAAEQFLRESKSLRGVDDVDLIEDRRPQAGHAAVILRAQGETYVVRIRAQPAPEPVYLTCRAPDRERPLVYELVSIAPADSGA